MDFNETPARRFARQAHEISDYLCAALLAFTVLYLTAASSGVLQ